MKEKNIKKLLLFIVISLLVIIGFYIFKIFYFSNIELETDFTILLVLLGTLMFTSFYLVRYYYLLLGHFCGNFSLFMIVISILYMEKIIVFNNRLSNGLEDNIIYILPLLMIIILLVYLIIPLIKCINDIFVGKKEIVLKCYSVSCKQPRKELDYYILRGKDKNNNKIELKSMKKIVNNENGIKIKYYENIKMIESFEYLEQNS